MPTEKETLYIAFSTQKGGGGQDDPDGAGGQLPALRERAERGGGGLRLPAAQHRRDAQARLENRHGGRTLQGDGLPPTATHRQESLPGHRGHGGGCRGKGGRTIGEAARTDIVFFDLPGTVNSGRACCGRWRTWTTFSRPSRQTGW